MNPNSDLKNNENVVAANAESRISEYAARFTAYSGSNNIVVFLTIITLPI